MKTILRIASIGIVAASLGMSATFTGRAQSEFPNIAVIEADPAILLPGESFDLEGATITFTPTQNGFAYRSTSGALEFESSQGDRVNLNNDASLARTPSFRIPFYGRLFSTIFINENGYITFSTPSMFAHFNPDGGADVFGTPTTALSRFANIQPHIAVLWQDWDTSAGGGVSLLQMPDRLIITWDDVLLRGGSLRATFQAVLFRTGLIKMSYRRVPATPGGGFLVGISSGIINGAFGTLVDFSAGSESIQTGAALEPLAQAFGAHPAPLIHRFSVARKFYKSYSDQFDQLLMFSNFEQDMNGALAFEGTARDSTVGIGLNPTFNGAFFFGSNGRLQGMANMNRLAIYPDDLSCIKDPRCLIPRHSTYSTLPLLAHETAHLWLAFVTFDDGGFCSDLLRGRQIAHWNFFKHSDASIMEGNSWRDNNDGTFTTTDRVIRFSALDQYVMGLRPPSEVSPFFLIGEPSGADLTRSSAPRIGVTVSGVRKNVTIQDVIECSGPRFPQNGITGLNSSRMLRQAFILVVRQGTTPSLEELTKLETIRVASEPFFNSATEGRGSVSTSLEPRESFILSTPVTGGPVPPGQTTGVQVRIQPINNFNQPVNLQAFVFPSGQGLTARVQPEVLSPGAGGIVTITAARDVVERRFHVVVQGASGDTISSIPIFIDTVSPNFSLGFSPSSLSLERGEIAETTLAITRIGGFAGDIKITTPDTGSLRIKVKPRKTTTADSSIRFTISAKPGAKVGSYQLVFNGRDETGRRRSAMLNVTVGVPQ
jgi:hypothetical protein